MGRGKKKMNRFTLAITLLSSLVLSSSAKQCKSRTATLEEYVSMVFSEIENEFLEFEEQSGKTKEELFQLATPVWESANDFEWERGFAAYEATGDHFPYVICHSGPGLSGKKRKDALLSSLEASINEVEGDDVPTNITDIVDSSNVAILSNTEEIFCGLARMPAPIACNMGDEEGNIIVQPMVMSMKLAADVLTYIIKRFDESADDTSSDDPVAIFTLCPGSRATDTLSERNVTIDQAGGDITLAAIEFLLARSPDHNCDGGSDANLTTPVSQNLFWTGAEDEVANQISITRTVAFWGDIFRSSIESCECDDFIRERLHVTLEQGDPELGDDPDVLRILFNRTNEAESDKNCALALIAAGALLPETCFVEVEQVVTIANDVAQTITQSAITGQTPIFDAKITGMDQIVAISDTGIDLDNCYFNQPSNPSRVFNINQRKVVQYIPFADGRDDINGHGSHVSGIAAGHLSRDGVIGVDGIGNGMAPNAKIAFTDIGFVGEEFLSIPPVTDLLDTGRSTFRSYEQNAHVHSASWGSLDNRYTMQARAFDAYMSRNQNSDFLVVIAAGNSGSALNTVGSPATAKNAIAVGSHLNSISSMNSISGFSSRGPTADGRMKPDLLAPGQVLNSARSGTSCGVMGLQGTSMATPAVSGSAALVREYFEKGYFPKGTEGGSQPIQPSGALVKAVLMNGAQFVNSQPYGNSQGFGRINLRNSIFIDGKTDVVLDVDERFIGDGESRVYTQTINTTSGCMNSEFRATLVWVDPPGSSFCRNCLVNDLDLLVTKKETGETYFPNGRSSRDNINNAERVIVDDVEDGDTFEITVRGTNLAEESQRYAIVFTGCFEVDGATFAPPDNTSGSRMASVIIIASAVAGAVVALLP